MACKTLSGLEGFWLNVDKLPEGVSNAELKEALGCVALPAGLPFLKMDEVNAEVLALRGQIFVEGKGYEVWLVTSDVR